MIKFIDKDGTLFFGQHPYVHWFGDNLYEKTVDSTYYEATPISGQSINLQYTKSILVVSDKNGLTFRVTHADSIFQLVDMTIIDKIVNNTPKDPGNPPTVPPVYYNYPDALARELSGTYTGGTPAYNGGVSVMPYTPTGQATTYYVYQLIVAASTSRPGQYTEDITISESPDDYIVITVGADFYDYDEIMSINLENRGTEIPETIQKAIYTSDIGEAYIDNILINRKFKELISNYIDIMDNRGSYKSLRNSLEWFEWGENVKLYEVWKNEEGYFEKELENILSEQYQSLLYTHQKTTYLSLVAALTKDKDSGELDAEKNPVVESIAHIWSNDVLGLKISLLGAFFERYFMPIHLALKRASVETHVYTTAVKVKYNSKVDTHSWHDDWGVVDIKMDHTVVLGNINPVSVGRNTVFGYQDVDTSSERTDNDGYNITRLAGVTYLTGDSTQTPLVPGVELIDSTDDSELMTIWGNIRGHVGVVVPITVTVPLPEDDALNAETIVIYRYNLDGKPEDDTDPVRILERRLWIPIWTNQDEWNNVPADDKPKKRWAAIFHFNLLSTKEEKVSFTLQLHSLSGHTWTAAATYEAIDTKGATLEAYRVGNKIFTGIFTGNDPWATWNPYEGQYDTITVDQYTPINDELNPDKYHGHFLKQYIPCGSQQKYLNELVVMEVTDFDNYAKKSEIESQYYVLKKDTHEWNPNSNTKYIMCIRKEEGTAFDNGLFDPESVKRRDYIFVPQLHTYTSIDSIPLSVYHGKYAMTYNDYLVDPERDLIQIRAQYKYSKNIDPTSVSWLFENKTTHETIKINGETPQQYPFAAFKKWKYLSDGYWSVTMTFRFTDSETVHTLSRDSMFLVKTR